MIGGTHHKRALIVALLALSCGPALAGRGVASQLIRNALLSARTQGLKVRPACSFVVSYMKRHPEFGDLAE